MTDGKLNFEYVVYELAIISQDQYTSTPESDTEDYAFESNLGYLVIIGFLCNLSHFGCVSF